ncbi:unnamed protein product [Oikopleura dioica]|uniref:Glycosyl transferase family 1 domain-containing protein n=1 Tax=Oikopleura dioica TaxID=34765 RepID=E4X0Q0_OIKDI|nr:unnamed protein product [Oikopleura dioica]
MNAIKRICFTKEFVKLANSRWPSLMHTYQPQSISLEKFTGYFAFSQRSELIIIAGLRPVKDVHFGMDCFESLTQSSSMTNLQLLIIGPAIDRKYAETIFARINNSRNIYHLPLLKQDELFERVSRALCTINCSTSEGQSAAILESMALGIPVIARNIGGNQFIKSMGTLYNCPETFCKSVKENCSDVESWQRASENARNFVKEHHSSAAERDFYINTVNGALQNKLKFQLLNNNRD